MVASVKKGKKTSRKSPVTRKRRASSTSKGRKAKHGRRVGGKKTMKGGTLFGSKPKSPGKNVSDPNNIIKDSLNPFMDILNQRGSIVKLRVKDNKDAIISVNNKEARYGPIKLYKQKEGGKSIQNSYDKYSSLIKAQRRKVPIGSGFLIHDPKKSKILLHYRTNNKDIGTMEYDETISFGSIKIVPMVYVVDYTKNNANNGQSNTGASVSNSSNVSRLGPLPQRPLPATPDYERLDPNLLSRPRNDESHYSEPNNPSPSSGKYNNPRLGSSTPRYENVPTSGDGMYQNPSNTYNPDDGGYVEVSGKSNKSIGNNNIYMDVGPSGSVRESHNGKVNPAFKTLNTCVDILKQLKKNLANRQEKFANNGCNESLTRIMTTIDAEIKKITESNPFLD